jgi:hypothetical protein
MHGNQLDAEPYSKHEENVRLWHALLREYPALESRIDKRIDVDWGYQLDRRPPRPDQRLSTAELVVWDAVDPAQRRPSSPNITRGHWPWRAPIRWLVRGLWRINVFSLSDSTYYASREGEAAVRSAVYEQVLGRLEAIDPVEKVRLHLIGSSLGTVVAHDFLWGLFSRRGEIRSLPWFLNDPQLRDERSERVAELVSEARWRVAGDRLSLGSLTMFGSQLPHFATRRQTMVDTLARGEFLDPAQIGVIGSVPRWHLFYDACDVVAYPTLRLYRPNPATFEFEVRASTWPTTLHGGYERNRTVLSRTAKLIYDRSG